MPSSPFADRLAAALGAPVTGLEPVRGGSLAAAFKVRTADGRVLFAKQHDAAPPGAFPAEAGDLRWLRAADVVPVPEVVAVADTPHAFLVLEWVEPGGRASAEGDAVFGRGLARLHRAGAPTFGRLDGAGYGVVDLPNLPTTSWAEFYAVDRLLPLARLGAQRGALAPGTCAAIERLAGRLDRLGVPEEPPSRVHGDLWGGNRLVAADGTSWLIDPWAHGGHRESDLAMMHLFGGFSPTVHAAYAQEWPVADGAADRWALHQIVPLAIHALLFGGGYAAQTADAVRRYA